MTTIRYDDVKTLEAMVGRCQGRIEDEVSGIISLLMSSIQRRDERIAELEEETRRGGKGEQLGPQPKPDPFDVTTVFDTIEKAGETIKVFRTAAAKFFAPDDPARND